jgi:hypothetical protein
MKRCIHCGRHIIPATPLGASFWRHEWSGWRQCTAGDVSEWATPVEETGLEEPA